MQKYLSMSFFLCNFASRFDGNEGKMLEWLKRHAWKACKPQKGFRGSNPRLSAKILLQDGDESVLLETD